MRKYIIFPMVFIIYLMVMMAPLPGRTVAAATLFTEDFSGVLADQWITFGDGWPMIRVHIGNPIPSFESNGDKYNGAGALSIQTFDYSNCLRLEADAYIAPDVRDCDLEWMFGLAASMDYGVDTWPGASVYMSYSYRGMECAYGGGYEGRIECGIIKDDGTKEVFYQEHFNDYLGAWHRFAIDIGTDLIVRFYIDDVLIYQTENPLSLDYNNMPILLGRRSGCSFGHAYHDNIWVGDCHEPGPPCCPEIVCPEPSAVDICGPQQVCVDLPAECYDQVVVTGAPGAVWADDQLCFDAAEEMTYTVHATALPLHPECDPVSCDAVVTVNFIEGCVAGHVIADCPEPDTPVPGVLIDAFDAGGVMVGAAATDAEGYYEICGLPAGDYMITMVTPDGYMAVVEEIPVTVDWCDTVIANFPLTCEEVPYNPATIGYWKHQVGVALSGRGTGKVDAATLCYYLDMIEARFTEHPTNPVVIYDAPPGATCVEKLEIASAILNVSKTDTEFEKAAQQMMALLLNATGGYVAMYAIISLDGATLSQAITYCDELLDDGDPTNDVMARDIASIINEGKLVPIGVIPLSTPYIVYRGAKVLPDEYSMSYSYPNPFNPTTAIKFNLPEATHVTLEVYNIAGQKVITLVDEYMNSGEHTVVWNGMNTSGQVVSSGIYLYRFSALDRVESRKMILLK